MRRVKIVVEGQTEESFVNGLLAEHLALRGVFVTPILLTTKRTQSKRGREQMMPGRSYKGGITSYAKIKMDVRNALADKNAMVTTMIDFYGLPDDFPGVAQKPTGTPYEQVVYLEQSFANDIGSTRFWPFLVLHEYEALLFSQPEMIANAFPGQEVGSVLQDARNRFTSPEEINQGRETHPAARIQACVRGYKKPFHGVTIAQRIGLAQIRHQCHHFEQWVAWLESLSS
ncbi:MAG: DUF4276 family protein [Chloroflexota bacterium]